ncbi:MAG: type I polyketide synthase, partial [Elusimicrobiota bacterium]
VDFPKVIEAAYRDGVRVFLEMGPGASCTRMIGEILGNRPHVAVSACSLEEGGLSSVLRLLAQCVAARVPFDLRALYGGESEAVGHRRRNRRDRRELVVPTGGEPFCAPELPQPVPVPTLISRKEPVRLSPLDLKEWRAPVPEKGGKESGRSIGAGAALLDRLRTTETAKARAHEMFLRLSREISETYAAQLQSQMNSNAGKTAAVQVPEPEPKGVYLDREQCLEFARGSIAKVLGAAYAEIDSHPTRVRLPDEPLMLVDRMLEVEGEPLTLGPGRLVTEHDVRPGAWYLDADRAPVCISVEAGQADLFLTGYLGIDFKTRGRAVYRLLDAAITFHRGLPRAGETIRYDIRIREFFRQGETILFRFEFDGTVGGETVLSMRNGCAGFFTKEELDAGKGIVHTALDTRPVPGVRPADWGELAPLSGGKLSDEQVSALRRGDLEAAFGPEFSGLGLKKPVGLPGGRMRLVDRVVEFDPKGGRFGLGKIRAEADIHPDDWFLACHFVDDKVMPGTLMYESCLHTLRIHLLRLGWVAEGGEMRYEPVPGIAGRLKCRGQVTQSTKKVVYEISI